MPEDNKRHWHIKPEVSVGHMISTIALAGSLIVGWNNMSDRVVRMEERTNQVQKENSRQNERMEGLQNGIDRKLERLDTKLDRLIERELNNKSNRNNISR